MNNNIIISMTHICSNGPYRVMVLIALNNCMQYLHIAFFITEYQDCFSLNAQDVTY